MMAVFDYPFNRPYTIGYVDAVFDYPTSGCRG